MKAPSLAATIAVAAVALSASSAHAQNAVPSCSDANVTIDASMSGSDVRAFDAHFRDAFNKVCGWWGNTYSGRISIEILDTRGPSMALVPAWRGNRGRMIFRSGAIREGISATVHEIIHLFAPNANRFLAEGLAVYGHEHLANNPAYPTYGEDLHAAAKPLADAAIEVLEQFETPTRMTKEQYVVAGSFVRYLVETHGLDKFRRLYALTPLVPRRRNAGDPSRWESVYGIELAKLAAGWHAHLLR